MVPDWQGLLKFTLKYTDGTSQSDFKEMSAENKKWLEEAMQQYCNSELKRLEAIIKEIEQYQSLPEEHLLDLLEEFQELLDSLDKGSTLYKMGGHIPLLKIIFYSPYQSCKIVALQIYSSANQNDAKVQNQSINTGALEIVELLKKEQPMPLKENLLGAVSSTIRGQNLEAKRIFLRLKGLELVQELLKNASQRLKYKIYVLLRDLLFYDDRLHFTYNDLSSFSNTANIDPTKINEEKKHDLTYDPNQQLKEKNELPENKEYKGMIHRFLEGKKDIFQDYLQWLKERIKEENEHQ